MYTLLDGQWVLVSGMGPHAHPTTNITDLGSYPNSHGQATIKIPTTDGLDGWTYEDPAVGQGIAAGGTTNQALTKQSTTDHDTTWGQTLINAAKSFDLPVVTSGVPIEVMHNFSTRDIVVSVVEKTITGSGEANGTIVPSTISITSANTIELTFGTSAPANTYRVRIIANGSSVIGANDVRVQETQPTVAHPGTIWLNSAPLPVPMTLTGLIFWLAADEVTGKTNGDLLTPWNDLSGNNRNFTTAAATWNTNRTPTGGPAAVSTYSSFTITSFMGTAAPSGAELFFCFKPTVTPNNFMIDWGTDSLQDHWPYNSTEIYSDFGSNSRKNAGSHLTMNQWTIISVYSTTADWGIYKNGSLIYSTSSSTVAWSGSNHGIANGSELAECFAYSRKLTTQERTDMVTYLQRHIV